MAEFNPRVPQVNDPELEAALNRVLRIIGPMGKLNVADTVVPVVNLVDVTTPTILVETPAFTTGEQFGGAEISGPVAGQIFADTLGLTAGTYDVIVILGNTDNSSDKSFTIQHRNAADSANLFEWHMPMSSGNYDLKYSTIFAQGERLRVLLGATASPTSEWSAAIFAKRRL